MHWTQVLVLSECGFKIPARSVAALVSLSKTLNHNCFVLRMGGKAVGPVCCVMYVKKEPRTLIVTEKGLAPVFLDSRLEHPAGWIYVCYKSSVLLLDIGGWVRCSFRKIKYLLGEMQITNEMSCELFLTRAFQLPLHLN